MRKQLAELFESSPITAICLIAGAIALATTPLAVAWMSQQNWFHARRGRTLQRPSWPSAMCGLALATAIPAIFLALLVKSQYFDHNRYEFDPNRTWSVMDQGRQFEARDLLDSARKLDAAVAAEQKRLADVKADLLNGVKKLDAAMLTLRESARQNPAVIPPMNDVLERLGAIRKAVGVDAPQQLIDLRAEPAAIAASKGVTPASPLPVADRPPQVVAPQPAAAPSAMPKAEADTILAAVPDPQKPLAKMLPLTDIPNAFVLAKLPGVSPPKYVETFNADNLFEKIDGRAESFVQFGVKGMACCSYHPAGNEEDEVQLFIFEMGDPLKARGKYDAERPEEAKDLKLGSGGYTAAGSVFFYSDRFYTIVNIAREDAKLAEFAKSVAEKVVALQKGTKGSGPSPEDIFGLLPAEPKKSGVKYVAKDVFGYSFLSDVFLADYASGDVNFQGFLRPYASPEEAKKTFDEYVATAKKDGAEVKELSGSKADKMIVSSNIGLFDVIFLKGNVVAGANGATDAKPAETFARAFAESIPANVPMIAGEAKPSGADEGKEDDKH